MLRKPKQSRRIVINKAGSGTALFRPRAKRSTKSPNPTASPTPANLRTTFDDLFSQWRNDIEFVSNHTTIITHPAYYQIIGMGTAALPYIFSNLAQGGGPWFVALSAITRANPVKSAHRNDSARMRADWIQWGKTNGYCA